MKTIQPFIEMGFHTVPLKGELKRLENGKKTIPQFEKDWKDKYNSTFNEKAVSLGGTMCGKVSGMIAIDCDSSVTYSMFKALDPENQFHFISKGKPSGGGTILYKYPEKEQYNIPSFSLNNETIKLDFYSDNGFVYLPTDANTTKEPWPQETFEEMPKLVGMPIEVYTMLKSLYDQYYIAKTKTVATDEPTNGKVQLANFLAPTVELMLQKEEFSPTLFRIITPKDFRELPQYLKHGYLHPDQVPTGRGSEYLSKVSAILGKDASIDQDLYEEAIEFINELWSEPMDPKQLRATIIKPMLSGSATINGESIWTYDKEWKQRGFSFINKLGEAIEVFFDDIRASYYLVNFTLGTVASYYKDTDVFSYIDTIGLGLPQRKNFKSIMPIVRTINDPAKEFGFYSKDHYTRQFNIFQQTPQLAILNKPEVYAKLYKEPEVTLRFFEHLVPHTRTRIYILKFLRKKLTTFSYSPVVLYFLGTHGSGKDTFVRLLSYIIGEDYIAKPTTKEFLEQYNGWIVDRYFVQLDEYGNQLSRYADKQEALGKIKAYSGKDTIQVRQMRSDGFSYKHNATFILTANTNPLLLEDGDRRALIAGTPNSMATAEWVEGYGGLAKVHELLEQESKDFCYYLATQVEDMSYDEYVTPLYSSTKHNLIADSLPAAPKLAYYFKHNMFDALNDLIEEFDVPHVLSHAGEQRIYEDDLFDLYSFMTDFAGVKRGMAAAMQDAGFKKVPTTKDGVKSYYFHVPSLQYSELKDEGFEDPGIEL